MNKCYELVHVNPEGSAQAGSSRLGTVHCTLTQLEELFGKRHGVGDGFKTSAEWYLITPRGRAAIRDYHLNPENQQSLVALNFKAARWVAAYLRHHGIKAEMHRY